MHWKLTDGVWWGDRHSLLDLKDEACSVLNLAHNEELSPGRTRYNPLFLGGKTPYFRFGAHDRDVLDDDFLWQLESLIDICLFHTPLLVHCYAGHHRSSIVAVWAAVKSLGYSVENYKAMMERAVSLRPDIQTSFQFNYSKSVQAWIEKRISEQAVKTCACSKKCQLV